MLATIILSVLIILQLGMLAFCLIFIVYFSSAFVVWPPSIPTDRKSRRTILNRIRQNYPDDAAINIADLGSGYGHLVRDIARNYKNAKVTGVELLYVPFFFGKLLCKRFKNIRIIKSDLFNYDLSNEDVVVFFFRTDHALDLKLQKELKPGTLVISNNFPLKDREPLEVIQMKETFVNRKLYIYNF